MLDEQANLLFKGLIAKVDTGNEFKWVTINGDLAKYIGERAYLSVEDDGAGTIAVDEIVFADGPPPDDPPCRVASYRDRARYRRAPRRRGTRHRLVATPFIRRA